MTCLLCKNEIEGQPAYGTVCRCGEPLAACSSCVKWRGAGAAEAVAATHGGGILTCAKPRATA